MTMSVAELDQKIRTELDSLSVEQKNNVLDYLKHIPKKPHSIRHHRRKAMKQIRAALQDIQQD